MFKNFILSVFIFSTIFISTVFAPENDSTLLKLTEGLEYFGMRDAILSSVEDLNDSSYAIIFGDEDTYSNQFPVGTFPSVARATFSDNGRVVAMGQECYATIGLAELDNMKFILNAVKFLDVEKTKRVLIDKGHSDWLDLSYGLIDSLLNYGFIVDTTRAKLNSTTLDDYGVLILGNSWAEYLPIEYETIESYVKSGNGLFIMGLGWSWVAYHSGQTLEDYPMNKIAMKFGLKFADDHIEDPTNNINGVATNIVFHNFYPDTPDYVEPPARPYRVLIDQSHDYSFLWDWKMGSSYLSRVGIKYSRNMATLDSIANPDLFKFDVIMIPQAWSNADFLAEEIDQIKYFVQHGGGLLLVGSGVNKSDSLDFPMVKLADAFNLEFSSLANVLKVFRIYDHEITNGVDSYETQSNSIGFLKVPTDWDTLITDTHNKVIAAAGYYGDGKIVALSDPNVINFEATHNQTLVTNIGKWLSSELAGYDSTFTPKERIYPENTLEQDLIIYHFARNMQNRVMFLFNNYDSVTAKLRRMMSVDCVYDDLNILALATGGGGYSSGSEVGIGLLTSNEFALAVYAHELTHSWQHPGGEIPWMGEGWAILSAERVCRMYGGGYEQWAEGEYQSLLNLFYQYDPMGKTIDITEYGTDRMSVPNGVYIGKFIWLIESLESKYGDDFMNRYFQMRRKYYDPVIHGGITTQKTVYFLSWAAGEELFTYFRSKRTLVEKIPVHPIVFHTEPANGDTLKKPSDGINITFNASMDTSSLNAESIKINGSESGEITFTHHYIDSLRMLKMIPKVNLKDGETLTIEVTNQVMDMSSMQLDGNGDITSTADDSYSFECHVVSPSYVGEDTDHFVLNKFSLYENYPNPFNSSTQFSFNLPREDVVNIDIRNIIGQHIQTLVKDKKFCRGHHSIKWTPISLPSGIYIIYFKSKTIQTSQKVLYLK